MYNKLTDDTKAIILLCSFLEKEQTVKPLTQNEYTALVNWLISVKKRPCDLLNVVDILEITTQTGIDAQRMQELLNRGVKLGLTLEKWQRYGIWVISRSDPQYPIRYKKYLRHKAPPLLYGIGNPSLLKGGGVAIVGSRNINKEGEVFTRNIAQLCAMNDLTIISGGARGVDHYAASTALEHKGFTIGVVAENLLKKSLEIHNREAIASGQLLLISPYYPEASFNVGNAMARNKLIYAMADYGLIINAEYNKGGTWAGAKEQLQHNNSIPIFVRVDSSTSDGNNKLIDIGAIKFPQFFDKDNFKQQFSTLSKKFVRR